MELVYKNAYGATYNFFGEYGTGAVLQLVVDQVGLFMSREDLKQLLHIVQNMGQPCPCDNCSGDR